MSTNVIIQARTGSTRLPNKVLFMLGRHCVLEWSIMRCKHALSLRAKKERVVVATTTDQSDDVICDIAKLHDVPVVRYDGKLEDGRNDVLGRFAFAATMFPADAYVRVTSDCPLVDPEWICRLIEKQEKSGSPYVSNVQPELDGFDVEVMSANLLREANIAASDPHDRHHVTPWMRKSVDAEHVAMEHAAGYKLSIDTMDDYRRVLGLVVGRSTVLGLSSFDIIMLCDRAGIPRTLKREAP